MPEILSAQTLEKLEIKKTHAKDCINFYLPRWKRYDVH